MRKTIISALLAAIMLLTFAMPATAETADAVSSASVADFYGDTALTGDDLMNALNSFTGFYTISTTNPDGSPNVGFFIFGCTAHEGKYYLQFGLAENQTRQNLITNGKAVAMYAANPSGEEGAMPYAVAGARMWAELVTDEELHNALNVQNSETVLFFEIVALKPLG